MVEKRKGLKFAFAESDNDKDRIVVSMIEHQGRILVATQKGIYKLEDDKMVRLQFVEKIENEQA